MEIKKLDYNFTVCKVEDYTQVNLDDEYCFIGKTDEEKSLVCRTEQVPGNVTEREDGWRAFRMLKRLRQRQPSRLRQPQTHRIRRKKRRARRSTSR